MDYLDEFHGLALKLEEYHSVFAQFWRLGKPIFTDKIPTACVAFNKEGRYVEFCINPKFWSTLDTYNKLFIISHECLHVLLNHGKRTTGQNLFNNQLINVCLDVVVNHLLISAFSFEREKIHNHNELCWLDTVFKDFKVKPEKNKNFEYYYNLFEKVKIDLSQIKLVDEHGNLKDLSDAYSEIIKELGDSLNNQEKKSFNEKAKKSLETEKSPQTQNNKQEEKKNILAGTEPGNTEIFCDVKNTPPKRKWEIIIKKWFIKTFRESEREREQFCRLNRRMNILPSEFFLPSENEIEDRDQEEKKIKVKLFLDTSGSCSGLSDRFFTAADSIPKDRFDIELYCFDTKIYKTDFKTRKLYGFGGTSFSVIGEYIEKCAKKEGKYPDAVWILTDGFGDNVTIGENLQKRWFWFLTDGGSTDCYPKGCLTFHLKDFE